MPLLSTRGASSAFGWVPRANPNLTSVESTIWGGGGGTDGGGAVKYTGDTLTSGATYTVTIGAAGSATSALSRSTSTYNSGYGYNHVNGTTTAYYSGSQISHSSSSYPGVDIQGSVFANPSGKGAGGNGANGSIYFGQYGSNAVQGGGGNNGYAGVTSANLSGFPTSVGCGGGGAAGGSANQYLSYATYQYYWINKYNGGTAVSGANTGNGFGPTAAAGSGGFTMRYSNTQPPLTSTTGTVVYLNSGGYHNYFWKSTGSFTV